MRGQSHRHEVKRTAVGPFSIVEVSDYNEVAEWTTYDVVNVFTDEVVGIFDEEELAIAHAEQLVEAAEKELLGE